ncbi:MAG: InlB B-repeat-containing protein, partial [Bacteroidales bacterium]|nr:InlB B-repeat-containing protein [Bacteroidales bacterium]
MRRHLVLWIVCLCSISAFAQWDGTSAPWTQGNGTQTNPYLIETPQHLAFLSDMVNAGVSNYQGQYFLLTQDISLSNQSWVPIGDATHPFKGHFNGGGHIIDSVLIDNNNYNNRGLWGYIDNGSVKKVVCGVEITTNGSVGAGGIVQTATNGTLIADCKVYGSISGHVCVGGIVGNLILGEVRGCENYATVTGSDKVGGVVGGFVGSGNRRVVSKCSNYGNIHSTGTLNLVSQTTVGNYKHLYYESYIGGVVGYAVCSTDTVSLCFNKGHISSQGGYYTSFSGSNYYYYYCCLASGICAQSVQQSSLTNHAIVATCYNTGNIQLNSTLISGSGISLINCMNTIGVSYYVANGCYSTGTRTVTWNNNTPITNNQVNYGVGCYCNDNNYYLNTVSTYGCGSPRTDANMKSVSFPVMLNTDSVVYVMDEFGINDGYPVFAWQTVYNVTTDNPDNVTSYAVQLNGHYGGTADSTGFMYWQQGSDDTVRVPLTPNATLQYQLAGLQPNTTYGYKLYVKRSGHTAYGSAVTFTTHPLYTVNVSSSNAAWGSVAGGGTFAYGETTTVSATATSNNYRFVQWSDGNTQNPRVLTVTQNLSLTAQFGPAIYTIAVSSANSAWGAVSGGGAFEFGQSITISATPATGYHFTQWSDGNTSNPRSIVVNGDLSLTANFAPNLYNVTVLPNNSAWGSVTGSGVFAYGSVDTLTATPADNYIFNQWSDGNNSNPRHYVVLGDTTITAQFSPGNCTLTLLSNNNAWGTVSGGGTYPYSQNVTCTATPAPHYHFVSWDDGNTSNPRVYILTGNTTLTAVFAPDQYTVTVLSGNSSMGTVSGSGTFDYGTIDTIRATAYDHYLFQGWSDGNTENPRYIQVTSNMTFTAQFDLASYTVNLSVNNTAWGTVVGGGTYAYGTMQVIAAQPATGYHFAQWSDGNADNPRMMTIDGDTSLVAIFAPNQYTVSVYSNDSTKGTVSGGGVYNYGQQTYIIATPLGSYTFSQWSDGNTEAFRSIIVTQNVSYTALFTDAFFEITGESNNPVYGTVIGGGSYANGSTVTLTAVANNGYHFVQWSDGSTENPRTVTVTANTTYYAQF